MSGEAAASFMDADVIGGDGGGRHLSGADAGAGVHSAAYIGDSAGSLAASLLREIRISRVLIAFCAGIALALSGAAFQSMFRNPLATPFTLGWPPARPSVAPCIFGSGQICFHPVSTVLPQPHSLEACWRWFGLWTDPAAGVDFQQLPCCWRATVSFSFPV